MSTGIHNLKPNAGSKHRAKRVGRGIGSGHGKTSTRGHKGNKARGQVPAGFEGGQTPLHRRLPLTRGTRHRNPFGFKNIRKKTYALVNVSVLEEAFEVGTEVTPDLLVARGILRNLYNGVKVLGDGEISKKLTIKAHKFSESAKTKIEAAGGTAEILG